MLNQEQLRVRLFTLSANRGVTFALGYLEHLERESTIPLWVYCCGSEMLLRNQLPARAKSLEDDYRDAAQARNATTQCQDGTWW